MYWFTHSVASLMQAHLHTCTPAHTHTHTRMDAYTHTHTRAHTYTHARTHIHRHTRTHIHIHTHTCTHACMHAHAHTHRVPLNSLDQSININIFTLGDYILNNVNNYYNCLFITI